MSLEYLKELHEHHEKWLNDLSSQEKDILLIEMNASLPLELAPAEYARCLKEVFRLANMKSKALLECNYVIQDKDVILKYKKLSPLARAPSKGSPNAVGFDLCRYK